MHVCLQLSSAEVERPPAEISPHPENSAKRNLQRSYPALHITTELREMCGFRGRNLELLVSIRRGLVPPRW